MKDIIDVLKRLFLARWRKVKCKPFVYYSVPWKKVVFGIDLLFTIFIYRYGITIAFCYPGTIFKRKEVLISFWPFYVDIYRHQSRLARAILKSMGKEMK